MKIGITGSRAGATPEQVVRLKQIFKALLNTSFRPIELHHGDCVGVDELAHLIAKEMGFVLIGHPPINHKDRAYCQNFDILRDPKPYLLRNTEIVLETEVLFVVPRQYHEVVRSGTWSTYRKALLNNRPTLIIYPDGNFAPDGLMIIWCARRDVTLPKGEI